MFLQAIASATGNPTEAAGAEADVALESENSPLKAESKDEVSQYPKNKFDLLLPVYFLMPARPKGTYLSHLHHLFVIETSAIGNAQRVIYLQEHAKQ